MTPAATPCPICAGPSADIGRKLGSFRKEWFHLRRCDACCFSFVANPWTDYAAIYGEDYYHGKGADPCLDYAFELEHPEQSVRSFEWEGILRAVGSLVPVDASTEWLDFGCGNGGLVRYCRARAGCRAVGFEEGWIAARAAQAGIPLLGRRELDAMAGRFDVITAIEVLEHVADPVPLLRQIRTLLKPGGLFFLTTGNARPHRGNLAAWYYVVPEIHVSFYEPEALRRAFEIAGLRPESRGYLPGFTGIIRFKTLKVLGVRRRALWQSLLPWWLMARVIDSKVRVSHQPIAWAPK